MKTVTVELFLAINESGDFLTSYESADDAVKELQDTYGCEAVRTLKLAVSIDLPTLEEIAVAAPALSQVPAGVVVS